MPRDRPAWSITTLKASPSLPLALVRLIHVSSGFSAAVQLNVPSPTLLTVTGMGSGAGSTGARLKSIVSGTSSITGSADGSTVTLTATTCGLLFALASATSTELL